MSNTENTKRIAKNTLLLYFRMMISMGVSLYTSRVVLATLGIEDFGVLGVVGGVVAMFSFINASMSGSTSRFLTFALGEEDLVKVKKTFSTALTIHFLIALLIFILAETVGLWFFENKLEINPDRMDAARIVFHLSVVSAMIGIVLVPYNAIIMAYERMSVYAYIEILNVLLKLGCVFLLLVGNFDKLIFYTILIFSVSVIISVICVLYCLKHFEGSKYKFEWDKKTMYPMLSFSGWDLYGNLSVIARTQGVNLLLNVFFGVILNAANSIAMQVQGAVLSFAYNIITAARPQIVKSYAAKNYQYTKTIVLNATKYIYLLLLLLSLPLILEMNFVLNLWLKNVPQYAVSFCRLTLLFNFFSTMSIIVVSAVHATGNNKRPSLINGSLYLAVIPVTYIAFKLDGIPEIPYICNALFVFIGMLSNVYTLKLYLPGFSFKEFVMKVLSVCFVISLVAFVFACYVRSTMPASFLRFCIVTAVSTITTAGMTYVIALDKQAKHFMKEKITNTVRKWKKQ